MKRYNDYFTLLFVTFLTLFSFFHMSTIVDVSHDVITIVFKNLLPSLLPFMILVSLCLNLGILDINDVLSLFCLLFLWLSNQYQNY